uniref:C2H2-type domain-containing protein n=1 Tax=Anopheles minimus TaxID=112268 RepID=A0A182VU33_9DIPT
MPECGQDQPSWLVTLCCVKGATANFTARTRPFPFVIASANAATPIHCDSMLNEEDTELDDTHLCIKCGSTVEGIENYIKHRKVNCTQPVKSSGGTDGEPGTGAIGNADQPTVALRVETATATEPAPYGTFDFTETIKEPEHHKKVPSYDYHNYELEPHHHHHHHTDPEHHRTDGSKAPDYKNEVNYEYELGADLFFSSLELQSSSKQKTAANTLPNASQHSGAGVIGGGCSPATKIALSQSRPKTRKFTTSLVTQLEPDQQQQQQQQHHPLPDDWLATPNESDKLMKAVSDISGHKKVELYPIFHQESPDPSDDDSEDEDDYNAPPRTHTGGKWKPENRPSPNVLRSTSHWRHWPPESPLDKSIEQDEEDDSFKSFSPPPGHTKGKWVPGSKIARLEYKPTHEPVKSYEDNYWCSICNRRLASRFVYERHLKSNLHLKRAQEEFELERAIKPPLYANELSKQLTDAPYTGGSAERPAEQVTTTGQLTKLPVKVKRKRKCYYTKCVVCQTRLPTHLLGKHLISRYHYRRMLNHPEQCFDVVLKNMHRIVLQSPFQCQPCRFYANNEVYFMEHWRSPEHEERVASSGKFWCSFCKFECEGNFQMTEHLLGANHREVIAVINRSVPIIIRKITRIRCNSCEQEFRYNAELRHHQRHCTAVSDEAMEEVRAKVQNTFTCELCSVTFPNRIRLLQHGQKLHRLANYYCSICECSFETAHESMQHRRTSRHKIMSARKNRKSNLVPKTCPVCKEKLPDVLELKQHIADNHPDVKYSCPQCGECFVLAQELGRHVRDKNCTFFNSSTALETPSTSSAFFVPYSTTEVLSIPASSISTSTPPPTTTTTHQLAGALPTIVPQAETSPLSSSATRPHLSGTNSIISNDSIKVNMNDLDMMENYSPANATPPPVTTSTYRIKLESFSSAVSGGSATVHQPDAPTQSPVVSNSDCDNIVAARSPQASAEIFFAMANNASENNTVYVDEIVGTIGEDGSVVCWQCKICPFRTSSQAEFLFHEILHSSKLDDKAKSSPSGSSSTSGKRRCPKITCPLCGKAFSKASLRCHLRQHTDERLFPCPHCPMAFTRKANLKNHIDNIHHQQQQQRKHNIGGMGESEGMRSTDEAGPSRRAICTSCGKSFANR